MAASDAGMIPLRDTIHDRCKCPVKLFEYMAMELPIIATNFGESAHVVQEVGCGLTSSNSSESLARAMDQIAEDMPFWDKAGKLGRKYLVEHQNWEKLSNDIEEVLGTIVEHA
jgi:glycosyltransferase involved in cell wall biosynthesis